MRTLTAITFPTITNRYQYQTLSKPGLPYCCLVSYTGFLVDAKIELRRVEAVDEIFNEDDSEHPK